MTLIEVLFNTSMNHRARLLSPVINLMQSGGKDEP